MPSLRDMDLRTAVRQRAARLHAEDPHARIVEELDLGGARADVVVLNGRIEGFEIKSDVDSLARLSHQAPAYEAVCDRVWLVTTDRFAATAEATLSPWWGLLIARGERGVVQLTRRRAASRHDGLHQEALASLLWRAELMTMCDRAGVDVSRSATVPVLVETLAGAWSCRRLGEEVRNALATREGWRAAPPSASGDAPWRPPANLSGCRVRLPPHRRR
jgi:hypothetical protein